jgi:hypothetical protein
MQQCESHLFMHNSHISGSLFLTTHGFNRHTEPESSQALVRPLGRVASSRVLVVGGGVAGQQAALDAAALGLPVTLAEAGPSLGGVTARLDQTCPTSGGAMSIHVQNHDLKGKK